jgi:hypothetical protein
VKEQGINREKIMDRDRREAVRRRAKQIRKAQKVELTTRDYIQRGLVVLIILLILAGALFVYENLT